MKASRVIIALAGLTMGASAFAAGSSTVSMGDVRKALKASPIGLNLLHAFDSRRDKNNNVNGHDQTHIAYLKYQLTDKDRLQIESRMTRKAIHKQDADYSFARAVLKYTRSGILSQDKHGINLSANLEKRYYPDATYRTKSNLYGLNRVSASMSRSMGKVNLSGTLYGAIYDRIDSTNDETNTHYLYAVLTQSYSFTDDWSFAVTEELIQLYNSQVDNYRGGANGISITAELGHQITPAVYAGVSVSGTPFTPYDGQLFAKNWYKEFGFGANVYWSAF